LRRAARCWQKAMSRREVKSGAAQARAVRGTPSCHRTRVAWKYKAVVRVRGVVERRVVVVVCGAAFGVGEKARRKYRAAGALVLAVGMP